MANKAWRPEGWKNEHIASASGEPIYPEHQVFEAGADAMLEALRRQGIDQKVYADHLRFGLDRGAKVLEGKEDTVTYQGVKGTLVFIPDNDDD